MIRVELKSLTGIKETTEEYEGAFHTDGVRFKEAVIEPLIGKKLVCKEFKEYSGGVALGVEKPNGDITYINHRWVTSFKDSQDRTGAFLVEIKKVGDNYIKVAGNKYIDIDSGTLINKSSLSLCENCGDVGTYKNSNSDCLCEKCLVDLYGTLQGYSFKPTPLFFGEQITKDRDTPVWYGIELEYGLESKLPMSKLVWNHKDSVYLKSDSSIKGGSFRAELVTHPHSFKELMGSCFIDSLSSLNAVENRKANGCHIHVSRSAFVDNKHYAFFYFLLHEMKDINEFVGGRELTNFCSFKPTGIIGKKHKDSKGRDRGVMVNECNDNTVECRFFSSTNDPDEVRMFIQFLESVIKYTKYAKKTITAKGWYAYVCKHYVKYPLLKSKLDSYPNEFNGTVTYKEPEKKMKKLQQLLATELHKVEYVKTTDELYKGVSVFRVEGPDSIYIICTKSNGNDYDVSLRIKDIIEIGWEE
jgi:hypothetical protein